MTSRSKKILLICFGVLFLITSVVIGIILYILAGIFDSTPPPIASRLPDPASLESAVKKLEATINLNNTNSPLNLENLGLKNLKPEDLDSENLDLAKVMQNIDLSKAMQVLSNPDTLTGKITLNRKEINALIDAVFTEEQTRTTDNKTFKNRIYDAWFKDGRFTLKLTVKSETPTPFGSYCNIEVVFIPQVLEHHLKLDLCSAKIGEYNIPTERVKPFINEELAQFEQTDNGQQLLGFIKSLTVSNNSAELEYDLRNLSGFLLDKLPELQKISNSDNKSEEIIRMINKQ